MNNFTNATNLPELLFDYKPNYKASAIYNFTHILDSFGIALADYRSENKLSQFNLAEKLMISQSMVSQYESASRNISIKTLCEHCEKLGIIPHVSFEKTNTSGRTEPVDDICSVVAYGTFG